MALRRYRGLSWKALTAAAAAACVWSTPTRAQVTPVPAPEVRQAIDANGVDVVHGSFNTSSVDIAIGPAGPQGLVYSREYRGDGWRDSLAATITEQQGLVIVSIGGASDSFTRSGTGFEATQGNGATLTFNGSQYRYTSADGAVAVFNRGNERYDRFVANLGWASYIEQPNGARTGFAYIGRNYCPHEIDTERRTCSVPQARSLRLQGVTNSYGYLLKLTYASNTLRDINDLAAWNRVVSVAGVNLATEYCDVAADSCTLTNTWPTATYSADGRRVTTPAGTATYDGGAGGITAITPPGATSPTVDILRDTLGFVSRVTRQGVRYDYTFVDAGTTRTMTMTGPLDTRRVVVSDTTTSLVQSDTDALGRATSYQYDANGRVTGVTAPRGNQVRYAYDARGNVTETRAVAVPGTPEAAEDIVTAATYPADCANRNTCNQPTATTDARGNRTDYEYTDHGGVSRVTQPAPGAGGVRPQVRYSYEPREARFFQAPGVIAPGQPIQLPVRVSACRTQASCDGTADEVRTTVAYGAPGAPTNLLPSGVTTGSGDNALTATTSTTYDRVGDPLTVDGPLPGPEDVVTFRHDLARRRTGVISPDPDGGGPLPRRAQRVTYDARALVTRTERGTTTGTDDASWAAFIPRETVAVAYDEHRRPVRQSLIGDDGGTYAVVDGSYDAAGRPDCSATRMNPASWGAQGSACTPLTAGEHGPDRIGQTIYNAASEVIRVRVALGTPDEATEVATTYSANGRPETLTDGEDNRTTTIYDGHDRVARIRYPLPNPGAESSSTTDFEAFTYDPAGNVTVHRQRDGQLIGHGYDNLDRLVMRDRPNVAPWETDLAYGYDLLGRRTLAEETGSGGHRLYWSYDALGRMVREESDRYGAIRSEYDLAGRRTRLIWRDGVNIGYGFLTTGEMTVVREGPADGGGLLLATYGYDALGRRTGLARGNGAATYYSYDPVSRLAAMTHDLAGTAHDLTLGFTYNPASQIASNARSNDAYSFTAGGNADTGYTPDGLNRYAQVGAVTPYYDARGNLTSYAGAAYGYTADNQLTLSPGSQYAYDPAGRLWHEATAQSILLYDGGQLVMELASNTNTIRRRYVPGAGLDEPLLWYEGAGLGDRRWYHADERGSVVAVSDAGGGALAVNRYDDHGVPQAGNLGRFQYTGQQWLAELGMYHYRARMYNPALGRFMQEDPIGFAGGANLYAYVGGDPVNRTDPSGLCFRPLDGGCYYYRMDPPAAADQSEIVVIGRRMSLQTQLILDAIRNSARAMSFPESQGGGGLAQPSELSSNNRRICDTPLRGGRTIRQNVATIAGMLQGERDAAGWSSSEQAATGSATVGFWFGRVAGGAWGGPLGEPWGNWNYGATGRAAEIPLGVLLRGAGAAEQLEALTGRTGSDGRGQGDPLGGAPYGDNPAGQDQIRQGYNAQCN